MNGRKIICLFFAFLCMIIIFLFSSKNSSVSNSTSKQLINKGIIIYEKLSNKDVDNEIIINKLNYPVRKIAHYSIYFLLGIFVYNVVYCMKIKYKMIIAIIICFLYASFDEVHQLFVSGRTGQFRDILIDTLGAISSILIFSLLYKKLSRSDDDYSINIKIL